MEAYQLNPEGIYLSTVQADPNPLELGEWLIPGGCVTVAPPEIPENKLAWFVDGEWHLIDPPEVGDEPTLPTLEGAKARKLALVDQWLVTATAVVAWDGNSYQTDTTAKERLSIELQMAQIGNRPDPSPWRTLANDMVMLSNAELGELCTAIWEAHRTAIFTSFGHKDAIAALTTIEDVENYSLD